MAITHPSAEEALPIGTWRLDPARTTVTITAKKLGFFTIPATLGVSGGSVEIGPDHRVAAVEVAVDAASYTSANDKRNEHVRSADFLDADQYPTIGFRAERVEASGAGYRVDGSVTVKGRSFPLSATIADVTSDGDRGSFTATATIDRSAIGVDKMPSFVIGRELELSVAGDLAAGADR